MEQSLTAASGEPVTLSFTPALAPMPRGILATSHRPAGRGRHRPRELQATLQPGLRRRALRARAARRASGRRTAATYGSNAVHLQVAADQHSGRAVVVAALDNLVKGAAGQAVQNANLSSASTRPPA